MMLTADIYTAEPSLKDERRHGLLTKSVLTVILTRRWSMIPAKKQDLNSKCDANKQGCFTQMT